MIIESSCREVCKAMQVAEEGVVLVEEVPEAVVAMKEALLVQRAWGVVMATRHSNRDCEKDWVNRVAMSSARRFKARKIEPLAKLSVSP